MSEQCRGTHLEAAAHFPAYAGAEDPHLDLAPPGDELADFLNNQQQRYGALHNDQHHSHDVFETESADGQLGEGQGSLNGTKHGK